MRGSGPVTIAGPAGSTGESLLETTSSFRDQFTAVFDANFARLFRYLDRLSGEPDLAADLAQEAFVRLYRRGALPDSPEAWLITVAMNLFRNARTTRRRRERLLTAIHAGAVLAESGRLPDDVVMADETRARVRAAIDRLPEREQRLLLLSAEDFSYREIAQALGLHEGSVGTLLARARRRFRALYEERADVP
jgi:RNA polymerase sigma-70 factor (ECF subfamily)